MTELDPDTELSTLTAELARVSGDRIGEDPANWATHLAGIVGSLIAYTNRLAEQADNLNEVLADLRERVATLESRQ